VAKILVFDDDPRTLELHAAVLGGAGHAVLTATDGAEALVLMDQNPALIVADLATPRVDGYEFIRRVRRSATHTSVPIIVVSAAEVSQRAIEVGADRFLQKPVSPTELRGAVDELLNPKGKRW
jgi:putative two-component system response regulator